MKLKKQQIKWILLAQCGNLKAFDELLKSIQYPLYRYISKLTCEKILAEDILQEVFILVYRKLRWLRQPELFYPWLYRLTSRETFRRLKKEKEIWKYQQSLSSDETLLESVPEPTKEDSKYLELCEEFPRLLEKISPASRAVLLLHYSEEMTLLEISEVLGVAKGTVKSRLAYGLTLLREAIKTEEKLAHFIQK